MDTGSGGYQPEAGGGAEVLAALGGRVEQFATTLPQREQDALRALLKLAAAADPFSALAAQPPQAILSAREAAEYERLAVEPSPLTPGPRSLLIVILKATRLCNLRCTYCFSWREGPNQVMSFPVLARTIRDALRDPGVRAVEFVWHGGEVTLLPPSWYRKALWLQQQFRRPGQQIKNLVQTNGTRISDEWLEFLRRYRFSVGVSLDGPPEVHDRRRVDTAGRATSAQVREGITRLQAAGIPNTGVLMVVDDDICDIGAARVLDYLLEIGVRGVAMLNVHPDNTSSEDGVRGWYVTMSRFMTFMCDLFRLWWPRYTDRIAIRELSDVVSRVGGGPPETCVFAGDCFGQYLTVEPTGDVSACDKYTGDDEYRFGNVLSMNLADIQRMPRLTQIREANTAALARQRANCEWFAVCNGGCPHDRYTAERHLDGYGGLCCGYGPLIEEVTRTLRADGRPVWDGRSVVAVH